MEIITFIFSQLNIYEISSIKKYGTEWKGNSAVILNSTGQR